MTRSGNSDHMPRRRRSSSKLVSLINTVELSIKLQRHGKCFSEILNSQLLLTKLLLLLVKRPQKLQLLSLMTRERRKETRRIRKRRTKKRRRPRNPRRNLTQRNETFISLN